MSSPSPSKDYSSTFISTKEIDNLAKQIKLIIFPNPSEGLFTLNFELKQGESITAEILDLANGKILQNICTKFCEAEQEQHINFDISALPAGTYFLRLKGKYIETGKMIIKK